MDLYNLSFYELGKNIVQAQRKHFLDDHISLEFMKEMVIVSNTRKHLATFPDAILAYTGVTTSNVKFLLAKDEQLENNLQPTRQEVEQLREQSTIFGMEEMRKAILVALETMMRKLYEKFVTNA